MQNYQRDVEEVQILFGDAFLQVTNDRIDLEPERAHERAEQRHANLDRSACSQLVEGVESLVLDEAAHLAELVHLQLRQHPQAVVDAPAVDLLNWKQRTVAVS